MPRYGRVRQIAAARPYSGGRAPGATRPIAVAAASDEVAWAEGNESSLGSAGQRRQAAQPRAPPAHRELDHVVDPDGGGRDGGGAQPARASRRVDGGGPQADRDPDRTPLSRRAERLHRVLGLGRVAARAHPAKQPPVESLEALEHRAQHRAPGSGRIPRMEATTAPKMVPGYRHVPGNHCGSTALRNLLAFHGAEISEEMALGLGRGRQLLLRGARRPVAVALHERARRRGSRSSSWS